MATRIKLGLVFKYDESWVAGSYYILNLINALKTLPEQEQPQIILFSDLIEDQKKVDQLKYPYLIHKVYIPQLSFLEKLVNKFSRSIFKRNWIEKRMTDKDVDYVFLQRRSWETDLLSNSKKIFWIPDCQELIMPALFFKRELDGRKHVYNEIITAKSKVLFSSKAALNDFKRFYPNANNHFFVVNFAVTHPKFHHLPIHELIEKYNINKRYFIIPNQFWVHKNHQVVLDAALILKNRGIDFYLVFTGKENDFRAPEYTQQLKEFVQQNKLNTHISFLGFIPREEQLTLMKYSIAIIQPSLFEGWSTVVEDAKAMNHWIILSDIAVHQEQINNNVSFFDPKKGEELAKIMQAHIEKEFLLQEINYQQNIENFGRGFQEILKA